MPFCVKSIRPTEIVESGRIKNIDLCGKPGEIQNNTNGKKNKAVAFHNFEFRLSGAVKDLIFDECFNAER
jgi:hypothetical protein